MILTQMKAIRAMKTGRIISGLRARHSYGPQGYRGMNVLIFEALVVGFVEVERLSMSFEDYFKGRNV
ncbi:hypothetical protein ACS0TY_030093 [Phlomoides rotata]